MLPTRSILIIVACAFSIARPAASGEPTSVALTMTEPAAVGLWLDDQLWLTTGQGLCVVTERK